VRLDTLHLTVRFLGQTAEESVAAIAAATAEVAAQTRPFEVVISGGGAFPSPERPRVLWLGITAGREELGRLAAMTNDRLAALGWEPDTRPFRAHLTLARSDGVRAGPRLARRLIAAADGVSISWPADRLVLFESITGGGPARYVPLAEARLGGEAATVLDGSR
jgi:2'-5' RNA ligase